MVSARRKEAVPKESQLRAGTLLLCTLIKYLLKSLSSYSRGCSQPTHVGTLKRRCFLVKIEVKNKPKNQVQSQMLKSTEIT